MNTAFVQVDHAPRQEERNPGEKPAGPPEVKSLAIESTILYRYAKTTVTSRLVNTAGAAREISFDAVLPQSAFISAFHIELNGKTYHAYIKEKEEANKEYTAAVSQGRTAAKVDLTARDSNRFTVSVNVEAEANVTFKLTYEELLTRRLGVYSDIINIDPGQIVPELSVLVNIEESYNLTTLRVPSLRVTSELTQEGSASVTNDPLAVIDRPASNKATIRWNPTANQQRALKEDGVKGQLTVEYDIERKDNASQILVSDGYFVHFYSPEDLAPLNKHVVFVLDMSGSMSGMKLKQLQEAMRTILSDLRDGDYFSIALFAFTVQVWRPNQVAVEVNIESETELSSELIVQVNPENIRIAKEFVDNLNANGGTNINDALMTSLDIIRVGQKLFETSKSAQPSRPMPAPMVIFLTDGQANVGQSDTAMIVKGVTQKNTRQASIFSLSFGRDADQDFLKKLSLKNSGFSRLIYEASDAALQLSDFYRQIASPLLANVAFTYDPKQVDNTTLTNISFSTLFRGAELVVAGKLTSATDQLTGALNAMSMTGECRCIFPPPIIIKPAPEEDQKSYSFMEKLWAYLNIQQLLDKQALEDGESTKSKERALELALKYSFVTPLTSLVVVKPDESSPVNAEDAALPSQGDAQMMAQSFGAAPPMMMESCPPMMPLSGTISESEIAAIFGSSGGGAPPMMMQACPPMMGGAYPHMRMMRCAPAPMMPQSNMMPVSASGALFGSGGGGASSMMQKCKKSARPMPPALPGSGFSCGAPYQVDTPEGTSFQCDMNICQLPLVTDAAATLEPLLMDFVAATDDTLWRITNESGSPTHSKVNARSLNPDDWSSLYVWMKKTATSVEKTEMLTKVQQFLIDNNYTPLKTQTTPRLLRCRVKTTTTLEEIQHFQQANLDDSDVWILDAGDDLYIWVGSSVTEQDKLKSLEIVLKYLQTDPSASSKNVVLVFTVTQGQEPGNFTSLFPSWSTK